MAWPFRRRNDPDSLVGSVSEIAHDGGRIMQRKSRDAGWQKEAWAFYHDLGEVRFCARYMGNTLARVRFFVGTREHPGDPIIPIPDDATGDDVQVRDILERIKGRDGTFESLVRVYGLQQFVAGESYLVGEEGLEGETWEFLSTSELRRIARGAAALADIGEDGVSYERDKKGDNSYVALTQNSLVLRFWQRDPEFRERADSPLRPVLDICEALHTAQAMQTAGDKSRLATMGLFLVPAEADLPKAPVTDTPGQPKQQPRLMLLDSLEQAMEAAMENPGSVAALSPIMLEVKESVIKAFTRVTFEREVDKTIVARIDHLIRRFAQGVDLPPEKLLGVGDLNHWSAWEVSEETVSAHVMPLAANFCEDMTVGWLQPVLDTLKLKDPEKYAIGADATDLIVSPDRAQHAITLFDRYELGGDHLLEALGFDPSMRPDLDEIIRRIMITRASNVRNPDPGPDIAALQGKAPPPTAAEKPVPGEPNAPMNPQEPLPPAKDTQQGKPSEQTNPDEGAAPKAGSKANGKQQPPQKQGPQQKNAPNKQKTADAKKSAPKRAAKAGVIGQMVGAIDIAIDQALQTEDVVAFNPVNWQGLRTTLMGWGLIDLEVADRVVDGCILLARGARANPGLDVMSAATVLVEAAMFDDEDLVEDEPMPV